MNLFAEQPLVVLILGTVVALAAGAAWASTGKRWLLVVLGLVVLLTAGGMIAEHLIVTDREAIEATLLEIADDVESNDFERLTRHIYSGAPDLQAKAAAELPGYKFTECRITTIHTTDVDASADPRSALVEFNIVASGSFQAGGVEITDQAVRRWIRLHLVRENDGRWAVQDYEHDSPDRMLYGSPMMDGYSEE
jgi:hypothetical protein